MLLLCCSGIADRPIFNFSAENPIPQFPRKKKNVNTLKP